MNDIGAQDWDIVPTRSEDVTYAAPAGYLYAEALREARAMRQRAFRSTASKISGGLSLALGHPDEWPTSPFAGAYENERQRGCPAW